MFTALTKDVVPDSEVGGVAITKDSTPSTTALQQAPAPVSSFGT